MSSVPLRPEEEERSEDTERQIEEESQGREVDVELPVSHAEREDLEERQGACCKYVKGSHVEERSLLPPSERADVARSEVATTGAVPEVVANVKWIAPRCLQDLPFK